MLLQAFSRVLNFILPPRKSEALLATLTLADLHALQTGTTLPYHAHEVQALVWELKYYGSARAAALAGEFLADELLAIAAEELGRPLLIPIPMHASRRSERGHNHTELLCQAVLEALGSPAEFPGKKSSGLPSRATARAGQTIFPENSAYDYAPTALTRTRMTPEQQKLSREARLNNLKHSMQASRVVAGRVCVVVDDVTTTGATFTEATRALKAAGALRVHCVALAQS
jgi:predicted amidophosphoribosyltransferase